LRKGKERNKIFSSKNRIKRGEKKRWLYNNLREKILKQPHRILVIVSKALVGDKDRGEERTLGFVSKQTKTSVENKERRRRAKPK
jgi:hypothetical protein